MNYCDTYYWEDYSLFMWGIIAGLYSMSWNSTVYVHKWWPGTRVPYHTHVQEFIENTHHIFVEIFIAGSYYVYQDWAMKTT